MSVETFGGRSGKALTAQLRLQGGVAAATLTGNLTLTGRSANFLSLDGGLSHRDITLPVMTARSASPLFFITNRGTTNNLVVKNSAGSTIVTLTPADTAIVGWDGTVWRSFIVADVDVAALSIGTSISLADAGVLNFGDDDDVVFTHSGTTVTVSGTKLLFSTGLKVGDDATIVFGTDDDASVEYDEDGTDQLRIAGAVLIVGTGVGTGKLGVLTPTNVANAYEISDGTTSFFKAVSTTDGEKAVVGAPLQTPKGRDVAYMELLEHFALAPSGTLPPPWAKDVHNSATGDYVADAPGGVYELLTAAASEAEAAQITHGNQHMINLSKTPIVRFRVRFSPAGATLTADERFVVGVVSDHTNGEDSLDSTTINAWFRVEGANLDILWESDDNITNDDDNDSGINIVKDAYTLFEIDFTSLADVKFRIDGVDAAGSCSMAGLSANTVVQPIVCIQRDAGSEVNSLRVDLNQIVQQVT